MPSLGGPPKSEPGRLPEVMKLFFDRSCLVEVVIGQFEVRSWCLLRTSLCFYGFNGRFFTDSSGALGLMLHACVEPTALALIKGC